MESEKSVKALSEPENKEIITDREETGSECVPNETWNVTR